MTERGERLMLMSIRSRFVADLLSGRKTVELRRTRPLVNPGQPVAIYETVPVAAITAVAVVGAVTETSPTSLWDNFGDVTGLTRHEFRQYFSGCRSAIAIHLLGIRAVSEPVTLAHLRRNGSFQPPQTWNFLDKEDLRQLLGEHGSAPELIGSLAPEKRDPRTAFG